MLMQWFMPTCQFDMMHGRLKIPWMASEAGAWFILTYAVVIINTVHAYVCGCSWNRRDQLCDFCISH